MDTFGFTKKKFVLLGHENQNKHLIHWLSKFYQKLTTNRVKPASFDLFTRQYNSVLAWTGMPPFVRPETGNTREWIEAVSDRIHHHRLATDRRLRDYDLLEKVQTDDLSGTIDPVGFNCHVALDGLRSLFNVGSIFRTCEAAGFKSIILGNVPGKDHPGVQKTAMGSQKWLEQESTDDLAKTLIEKKEKGFRIFGVETIKNARPFYEVSWEKNSIIVFGNEEYGISSHVMAVCDEFAHIPMFGKKNSINVANAAAVICFQAAVSLSGTGK